MNSSVSASPTTAGNEVCLDDCYLLKLMGERSHTATIVSRLPLSFILVVFSGITVVVTRRTARLMERPSTTLVTNLGVTGALIGGILFVTTVLHLVMTMSFRAVVIMGIILPRTLHIAISLTLTCLTLDRFLALCRPLRYYALLTDSRCCVLVVLSWLIPTIVLGVACIYGRTFKPCTDIRPFLVIYLVMFISAIAAMVVMNFLIAREFRRPLDDGSAFREELVIVRRRTAKELMVVVLLNLLFATPDQGVGRGVTLYVLLAGLVGGLLVVLSVLIFCRFCLPDPEKADGEGLDSSSGQEEEEGSTSRVPVSRQSSAHSDHSRISFSPRSGRGVEAGEHRRVSRQYSPALYLPGIPESKVIQERKGAEVKEEAAAGGAVGGAAPGRLRHSSSRSSRSGKRSQRSPPVQRQRCIQLEGGQSEEDGAAAPQGRAASRPHPPPAPDSRPSHIEADVSRVPAASPPPEVPLVVVATAEGGTRTQALGRSRGRLQHPSAYSLTSGGGESRDVPPRTHAYHKYGSASFDLARPSRHEGARAAFHTTRSSFEGDRRLSMSLGGPRAAAEVFQPVVTLEKSPGAARRLASMEAGSRGERQLPEGPLRGGFRRSRSERVGGSSAGASPARSESLRVSRTRPHPQDVEMTELCGPRRLLALDEYSSSSRLSPRAGSSPSGAATEGAGEPLLSGSAMARYSWRTAGDVAALRQSSLENSELEDLMENRRHVEQRRLRLAADSTTPSDEDEEPRGKVRYNDTGSLEQVTRQVNEELADHLDEPDLTSRHSQEIKVQCRALWQLRTTLEEEDPDDQDSDSGRMEIHSSPDRHSPGRASDLDNVTSATSHTTSFESNTDAIVAGEGGGDGGTGGEPEVEVPREHGQSEAEVSQTPITLPSSEARRTSYRAILANRLKQLDAANRPTLSSENSFDSVDTECSSTTDLSRPEVLTTSFDSTTDCPTDSTSDTHSHRLQQMKADSGYRSLEANNGRPPKLSKKQIHFVEDSLETPVDDPERDRSRERQRDPDSRTESREDLGDPQSKRERLRKGVAQLERRWSGKSHTKKRREALRERHASLDTALSGSVGGSLEGEGATTDELSGKRSVLARFLRTHRYPAAHYRLLQRDYSIDEKSDRLFKEFSRTEVPLEWEPPGRRGPRLYSGRRLHRHLDAEGSPRSHRRKLSPQDSIEEEDQVAAALWEGEASRPESFADSIGCDDLPVSFAVAEEVE